MFCGQQRWGIHFLFNEYHHTIESGVGMMILVQVEHGAGRVATQRRLLGTLQGSVYRHLANP